MEIKKKVAVVLSGCGVYDGSEIHETVLTILSLSKHGLTYEFFAPNRKQTHVVNHLTGEIKNEERNILEESARIARGKIKPIEDLDSNNFVSVVFPGGHGAAKNLSNYAFEKENYSVDKQVVELIKSFINEKKPILALCIAPMLIAGAISAQITIGTDTNIAKIISDKGSTHIDADAEHFAYDAENKIITTPCYMKTDEIYRIHVGIDNAVKKLISLI